MTALERALEAALEADGRRDEAEVREYLREVVGAVLDAVGYYALVAERDRYKADLDKVSDVFNARDAVTEGDAKLYANQPGEALANAVADILDDLTTMMDAAHCEARRAVTAEAERDRYRKALEEAAEHPCTGGGWCASCTARAVLDRTDRKGTL